LAQAPLLENVAIQSMPVIVKLGREGQGRVESRLRELDKEGVRFKIVMRCDSPAAIKEFVREGNGVGFLYYDEIKRGIARGEFRTLRFPGFDITGHTYIVYSKGKPMSPLAREFLSFVRASVANTELAKPVPRRISNGRRNGKGRGSMLRSKLLYWGIPAGSLECICSPALFL
jgi:DNA-binding transcriptional LysR family regulator